MINWIITSSILIVGVIILRRILRGRISLRLQYALWGLVLLRLLLPVSVGATTFSVEKKHGAERSGRAALCAAHGIACAERKPGKTGRARRACRFGKCVRRAGGPGTDGGTCAGRGACADRKAGAGGEVLAYAGADHEDRLARRRCARWGGLCRS